ncbi:hypothetical protein JI666_19990 [Bacillus sp. NTK071]|uniref:hypothetical protein n=1 Tax=Bacillus sp. NTK071 TaxID=2802175 RepID=UPI001A8E6F66|nr:hypothetical protein [Bacillus sp. NTK071]MBN8211025.1 hypothetical protein [Bacillus sp. NTK071]
MDLKFAAEIHRVGLKVGYFSVKEVIDWTDHLIETMDQPPFELIDVSLAVNKHAADVCSKLKLVKGHVEPTLAVRVILALINRYLIESRDFSKVDFMLSMVKEIPLGDAHLSNELDWLLEWRFLARVEMIGNLEDVRKDIEGFLEKFSDYEKYYTYEECFRSDGQ